MIPEGIGSALGGALGQVGDVLSAPRRWAWQGISDLLGVQAPESGADLVSRMTGLDKDSPWTHALGFGAEVVGDPLTYAGGLIGKGIGKLGSLFGRGAKAAEGLGEAGAGLSGLKGAIADAPILDPNRYNRVQDMLSTALASPHFVEDATRRAGGLTAPTAAMTLWRQPVFRDPSAFDLVRAPTGLEAMIGKHQEGFEQALEKAIRGDMSFANHVGELDRLRQGIGKRAAMEGGAVDAVREPTGRYFNAMNQGAAARDSAPMTGQMWAEMGRGVPYSQSTVMNAVGDQRRLLAAHDRLAGLAAPGERGNFLRAIQAAPNDPLPRMIYADWLDERGFGQGSEIIRHMARPDARTGQMPSLGSMLSFSGPGSSGSDSAASSWLRNASNRAGFPHIYPAIENDALDALTLPRVYGTHGLGTPQLVELGAQDAGDAFLRRIQQRNEANLAQAMARRGIRGAIGDGGQAALDAASSAGNVSPMLNARRQFTMVKDLGSPTQRFVGNPGGREAQAQAFLDTLSGHEQGGLGRLAEKVSGVTAGKNAERAAAGSNMRTGGSFLPGADAGFLPPGASQQIARHETIHGLINAIKTGAAEPAGFPLLMRAPASMMRSGNRFVSSLGEIGDELAAHTLAARGTGSQFSEAMRFLLDPAVNASYVQQFQGQRLSPLAIAMYQHPLLTAAAPVAGAAGVGAGTYLGLKD